MNINWKLVGTIATFACMALTAVANIADGKARKIETRNEIMELLAEINKEKS